MSSDYQLYTSASPASPARRLHCALTVARSLAVAAVFLLIILRVARSEPRAAILLAQYDVQANGSTPQQLPAMSPPSPPPTPPEAPSSLQPVCLFIHGAGNERSASDADRWGMVESRTPCSSFIFMNEETIHVGWEDGGLQERVCMMIAEAAARAASTARPLVIFAHSLGNVPAARTLALTTAAAMCRWLRPLPYHSRGPNHGHIPRSAHNHNPGPTLSPSPHPHPHLIALTQSLSPNHPHLIALTQSLSPSNPASSLPPRESAPCTLTVPCTIAPS